MEGKSLSRSWVQIGSSDNQTGAGRRASQAAVSWQNSEHGLAGVAGAFPGNLGG